MADTFSSNINPNDPGLDQSIATGQRVTTRTSRFQASASAGAIIAALVDPYGSGSTYATVGTVPAQLALSGSNIVKGAGVAVAGTEYKIRVQAASADGLRDTTSVLSFTAVSTAPAVGTPTIAFSAPSVLVTEGNSGTTTVSNTIIVNRNGVTGALVVNLTYGGTATAGTDYATAPVSVTIPNGQNNVGFDILVIGDALVEGDETIVVNAALAAYSSSTASATITITDDDIVVTPPGDSSGFSLPFGSRIALMGDSIDQGPTPAMFFEAAGHKLVRYTSYAVAGTEVDENPDNQDYADYQLPLILALNPRPAAVLVGGYENSSAHGQTFENMRDGYARIFAALRAVGIKIMVRTKIAGWGEDPAYKATRAAQVYNWLLSQQASDLILLDKNMAYVSGGNGRDSGGAHPSNRGSRIYGALMAADLAGKVTGGPIIPASGELSASNQNLNPAWSVSGSSGALAGTGPSSGTVADGFTVTNNTDATVVASVGALSTGIAAQVLTVSGTKAAGSRVDVKLDISPALALAAGDNYEMLVEYEMSDAAGTGPAVGTYRISGNLDGVAGQIGSYVTGTTDDWVTQNLPNWKGLMRFNSTPGSPVSAVNVVLSLMLDNRAVDTVLKVGRIFLRRNPNSLTNNTINLLSQASVVEGTGTGTTVTVTARRGHTVGAATVAWAVTGSGANPVNAADFAGGVLPSGTITIADGALTGTATFQFAGDSTSEPDEGLTVTISSPSTGYTVGANSITFSALDDDSGVSYDADASTLFGKMTVQPTTAKKTAISDFIAGMKTDGNWSKVNALFHGKLHDKQSSLLNWVPGGLDALERGTAGGLAHTPGSGWMTNGTAALGSRLSSAGKTKDSAFAGIWRDTAYAGNMLGNGSVRMQSAASGGAISVRMNASVSATLTATSDASLGLYAMSRGASTGYGFYRNGTFVENVNRTSTDPAGDTEIYFGGSTSTTAYTSAFGFSVAVLADHMTSAQQAQLVARLNTLNTALAA